MLMTSFKVQYEWTLDDTTGLSVVYIHLKEWSPFTSVVLDLAATLLTPETPKVFCGLKHFTHPSIVTVLSR